MPGSECLWWRGAVSGRGRAASTSGRWSPGIRLKWQTPAQQAAQVDGLPRDSTAYTAQRAEQDAALAVATGGSYRAADDADRLTFWRSEVKRLRDEIRSLIAGVGDDDETPAAAPTPQRA